MFYHSWWSLVRVLVTGVLLYAWLVVLLRISGKRTLSKLNAFDLVVTVALGSMTATVLLTRDVPLLDGMLGFLVLIGLQYGVAWMQYRSTPAARLVKSEPKLLAYQGRLLRDAMRRERIMAEEIHQAMRSAGVAAVEDAEAVVLETDGTLSVVQKGQAEALTALEGVRHPPEHGPEAAE